MADNHEFEADLISVLDDEGNEHQFEIIDTIEVEDKRYVALLPFVEPDEEITEEDDQAVIFEVIEEEGEEILTTIEDDDEFDRVASIFEDRLNELYDEAIKE